MVVKPAEVVHRGFDERLAERFAELLREAYPSTAHGTLLEYRRIFAVGHKP